MIELKPYECFVYLKESHPDDRVVFIGTIALFEVGCEEYDGHFSRIVVQANSIKEAVDKIEKKCEKTYGSNRQLHSVVAVQQLGATLSK